MRARVCAVGTAVAAAAVGGGGGLMQAREVLSGLLDRNPIKRFDAAEMKGLSFFKGVDWVKLMNKEYEPPIRCARAPAGAR